MKITDEELYLFIADISGYTRFMLTNEMAYSHAILAITELMKTLLKETHSPIKIAKLEGDAIFFYVLDRKIAYKMKKDPLFLGKHLMELLVLFSKRVTELQRSTHCNCGGCANIHKLQLKIIAHFGKASIVSIGHFHEFSGVDIILPHRLLKNHVHKKCYILLTDQASKKIAFPSGIEFTHQKEVIADLGTFEVSVCCPSEGESIRSPEKKPSRFLSIIKRPFKIFHRKHPAKIETSFRNLPPEPKDISKAA